MRVPLSWLREYVAVPAHATPADIHAALVKVGFEEEGVHDFGLTGPVVVGQVLELTAEPQSNGKTINWCRVDVGEVEPRGIVCGAHNFAVGDKVVVSLPGAILPGPFPIAARTTYGHVSDGMIASARELGLGEEHDGILLLSSLGLDPELGVDAIKLLGLDDWAVEINVTPDRGYALSLRGIAREYAHATGAEFHDPALTAEITAEIPANPTGFSVTISDQAPVRGRDGVTVFVTRVVRGIDASRVSPPWLVGRLALAGIRSLSLVVDITNYVMLELGQPLHGYDLDSLSGALTVRRANPGEKLTTLDGQSRTLHAEDLLITDESGPIGLAGVMGGASTEVSLATTAVLIEAANFDPVSVARSARRHKLPSEASKRFERGVDPLVADAAAARAVQLLVQLAGGTADALGSRHFAAASSAPIELPDNYVAAITGADYSPREILSSLAEIGCLILPVDHGLAVTAPSWRPDLTDKAALVEEVARIIGYDRIPAVLPTAPPGRGLSRDQRLRRAAAQMLAANGLTEVLSYPFISTAANDTFGQATVLTVANPLDHEAALLRTSLLPGLIEIARRNLSRGLTDLGIYEIGSVFRPEPGTRYGSGVLPSGVVRPTTAELGDLLGSIPPQPLMVAGLFAGLALGKQPGRPAVQHGLADSLDAIRQLAAAVNASVSIRTGIHRAMHPGRTAEIFVTAAHGELSIGFAGELLPSLADDLDLPPVTAVFELDLGRLILNAAAEVAPHSISAYPAATQDLSLVVADNASAGEVLAALVAGAGPLLELATLVDDYRGTGLPDGCKSLTFSLRFRAADRTLTAAEATEAKQSGAALAGQRFGATIRE